MILTIIVPVAADNVRHFKLWPGHSRSALPLRGAGAWQQIERADCRADGGRRQLQVAGGGGQTAMAEQELDGAQIDARFEQMSGEGVTHTVGGDVLVDAGAAAGLPAGLLNSANRDGLLRRSAGEE